MPDEDERILELDRRADLELEKLGVAEDLGWIIATLAAAVAYLKWGGWWLPVIVFLGTYYIVTYAYRRREDAARDAYHKASGKGKYYVPPKES